MEKLIPQVKIYDENGKELFLIENHNGALALSIIDKTLIVKHCFRKKIDRPSFVVLDEFEHINKKEKDNG